MPTYRPLTKAQINDLAWAVYDGTASPVDAERLLVEFVRVVDRDAPLPQELIGHVRDCLALYLVEKSPAPPRSSPDRPRRQARTLDQAFGLGKPKGRQRASVKVDPLEVTRAFLEKVLQGKPMVKAEAQAAGLYKITEKTVRAYWTNNIAHALAERALTDEQLKKLGEELNPILQKPRKPMRGK